MALPLSTFGPAAAISLARSVVVTTLESAATLASLPIRLVRLVGTAELLAARIAMAVDRAETLLERAGAAVDDADEAVRQVRVVTAAASLVIEEAGRVATGVGATIAEAELVTANAAGVIARTAATTGTAGELLASFEPTLRRAAPLAQRFVDELSAEEVTAAIRLVDELPKLREHLTGNVLPILGTLDKVGPDIHDLLEVTRDLKLAVAGIPGLKMLRRRGEDRLADELDEG